VLILTSAYTPMLWMGEEWAASTPWPYFTSHPEPGLAARADQRRLDEFARFEWDADRMISPQDPTAFFGSKLDWTEVGRSPHAETLAFYQQLIALRHAHPELADPRLDQVEVEFDAEQGWLVMHRGSLRVVANFSASALAVPVAAADILFATGPVERAGDRLRVGPGVAAVIRAR
jgi:maltooligosyltrehalose trehalohydrolase